MKQLIKEILVLLVIIPISLIVVFFLMQKAEAVRQFESFPATVEKKELRINSPVFGEVEKFSFEEGDVVKKDEIIVTIRVINKKDSTLFTSSLFNYDEKLGLIYVKSPADAVIVKKDLAEKSTVKPEENLITLYPTLDTRIKIEAKKYTNIESYQELYLTDLNESKRYDINLSDKLPIADKDGMIFYYASFKNENQATNFYNNQQLIVKAKSRAKALTGKVETMVAQIAKTFSTLEPFKF